MSFLEPATPAGRTARQRAIGRYGLPADARQHLYDVIAKADADTVAEGLGWYANARSVACDLADEYGFTVRQVVGVIAALSPQTGWGENVHLAGDACAHAAAGRTDLIGGHYSDACAKTSAILQGADPSTVLGGRKVRSFYANILRPTVSGPVTVDRHMFDLLTDKRQATKSRALERPGVYQRCAAVIRAAARELGLRPHECQAVAWVQWRKMHDVAHRHDLTDM